MGGVRPVVCERAYMVQNVAAKVNLSHKFFYAFEE